MRHLYYLLLFSLLPMLGRAQSVGIGTTTPHSSAVLEVSSSTQGILLPRLSQSEMNAILNPQPGLLIYNKTVNQFYGYALSGLLSTIEQANQTTSFPFTTVMQSFTMPVNGGLTSLTLYFANPGTATAIDYVTVDLYAGVGTLGTPLATLTRGLSMNAGTTYSLGMSFPDGGVAVAGRQQYTMSITFARSTIRLLGSSTNTYSGGQLSGDGTLYPSSDLAFRLNYLPGQWVPLN